MSTLFVKDYSEAEKNRLHVRLADFYSKYSPSDIAAIEQRMAMSETETDMFLKLCERYNCSIETEAAHAKFIGVYPPGQASPSSIDPPSSSTHQRPTSPLPSSEFKGGPVHEYSSAERNRLRTRLTNFYKKYAPNYMEAVEKAIVLTIPEKDIFRSICSKYNCTVETEAAEAKAAGVYPNQQAASISSSSASSPAEITEKIKLIGKIFDSYLVGDSFALTKQDAFAALCQHARQQNGIILDVFSAIQNHPASEINRSAFFSIAAKFFGINKDSNNNKTISSRISSADFCEIVRTGTIENVKHAVEVLGYNPSQFENNTRRGGGDNGDLIPDSVKILIARRDTKVAAEILTYLLERGADVNGGNQQNSVGPLFVAVSNSNVEGCKILLKFGADLLARGTGGMTPIHQAAFMLMQNDAADSSEVQILNLLLRVASITTNLNQNKNWFKLQNDDGNTVLHAAAYSSSEVALKTVLSKMKKDEIALVKQIRNKENKTALEVAAEQGTENAFRGFM